MKNNILDKWIAKQMFALPLITSKQKLICKNKIAIVNKESFIKKDNEKYFNLLMKFDFYGRTIKNFDENVEHYTLYFEPVNNDKLLAGIYDLVNDEKLTVISIIGSKPQGSFAYDSSYIYTPQSDFFMNLKNILKID